MNRRSSTTIKDDDEFAKQIEDIGLPTDILNRNFNHKDMEILITVFQGMKTEIADLRALVDSMNRLLTKVTDDISDTLSSLRPSIASTVRECMLGIAPTSGAMSPGSFFPSDTRGIESSAASAASTVEPASYLVAERARHTISRSQHDQHASRILHGSDTWRDIRSEGEAQIDSALNARESSALAGNFPNRGSILVAIIDIIFQVCQVRYNQKLREYDSNAILVRLGNRVDVCNAIVKIACSKRKEIKVKYPILKDNMLLLRAIGLPSGKTYSANGFKTLASIVSSNEEILDAVRFIIMIFRKLDGILAPVYVAFASFLTDNIFVDGDIDFRLPDELPRFEISQLGSDSFHDITMKAKEVIEQLKVV